MSEIRYASIKKTRFGWSVQYGGRIDGEIGWAEYPVRWRLTRKGAERYARKRHQRRISNSDGYDLILDGIAQTHNPPPPPEASDQLPGVPK